MSTTATRSKSRNRSNPQLGSSLVSMEITEKKLPTATVKVDPKKVIKSSILETIGIIKSLEPVEGALVTEVKNLMLTEGAKFVESDTYDGQISGGGTPRVIDANQFIALCAVKKIPKAKVHAILSVNKKAAEDLLSGDEIEAICVNGEYREPSLNVTRKKDAPPQKLMESIEHVATQAKKGKLTDAMLVKPKKDSKKKK